MKANIFKVLLILSLITALAACGKSSELTYSSLDSGTVQASDQIESTQDTGKEAVATISKPEEKTEEHSNSKPKLSEKLLLGAWHANTSVGAGFCERYVFNKDNTFIYYLSEYDKNKKFYKMTGEWKLVENNLHLRYTTKFDTNGKTKKTDDSEIVLIGGIEEENPENSPYEFKMKFNRTYFWRYSDENIWEDQDIDSNVSEPVNTVPINEKQAYNEMLKAIGKMPEGYSYRLEDIRQRAGREYYVFQVFESVIDNSETGEGHTATLNWYFVDRKTGEVYVWDLAEDLLSPVKD